MKNNYNLLKLDDYRENFINKFYENYKNIYKDCNELSDIRMYNWYFDNKRDTYFGNLFYIIYPLVEEYFQYKNSKSKRGYLYNQFYKVNKINNIFISLNDLKNYERQQKIKEILDENR